MSNLTAVDIIKGKFGTAFNRFVKKSMVVRKLKGYELIKDLTPVYSAQKERVGIYKNVKGLAVVIKRCHFFYEDMNALYLKNEAFILKTFTKIKSAANISPHFVDFKKDPHAVTLVVERVPGKQLDTFDKTVQIAVIKKIIEDLRIVSGELKKNKIGFPTRNPFYYFLSLPFTVLKVTKKEPQLIWLYLKISFSFYFNYLVGSLQGITCGLVHRDLYPDNILYEETNKTVTLLDWESAVVSDSLYDIAQVAMIYHKGFGKTGLIDFLNDYLNNNAERRRFIGLAIFNCLQTLSHTDSNHSVYSETRSFLKLIQEEIMPAIMYKKSPFEIVNAMTLDLIALFYKITGLPMSDKNKKIILCYHAVGNDGWRFSTRPQVFTKHIELLKKHYNLVSLRELLHSKKGGVNISFDDGYTTVFQEALPILKRAGTTGTLFMIGDTQKANREELENNLSFMNKNEVLKLYENGWEIGYHTETHPNLGMLAEKELQEELVEGKKRTEEKLGITLSYFAYPRGIYTQAVVEYVKKAGFKAAFTVDGTETVLEGKNKMLLDRVPVDGELTDAQLGALLSPLGLFVSKLFMKFLVFKEQYIAPTHKYSVSTT